MAQRGGARTRHADDEHRLDDLLVGEFRVPRPPVDHLEAGGEVAGDECLERRTADGVGLGLRVERGEERLEAGPVPVAPEVGESGGCGRGVGQLVGVHRGIMSRPADRSEPMSRRRA